MATSPVYRRYTSSVYEDKYFSEKNAAIPFKWESSPGRPKHDEDDCGGGGGGGDGDEESVIIPAVSMYPLRPPPKLCPVSPMRVKDVLQEKNEDGVDDDDDDDELQQLAAHNSMFDNDEYFCSSPRLQAVRFRSFRASCVVPLCKNYMNKHALQQRSRSFSHAAIINKHSGAASFRKGGMDSFASARRHSFAVPAGADAQVAAWAGAILAANSPSLEARLKLRDLLQQSGNFSEVLPTINLSNNGNLHKADDARSLQLLCLAAPEADEELVMAAFLRKGACTDRDHSAPTEEDTTSLTRVAVDRPKLKAKAFSRKLKLFLRNECTACWCPSSTATSSH